MAKKTRKRFDTGGMMADGGMMAKGGRVELIFHGSSREIPMGEFESSAAAKRYVESSDWQRPYSIKKIEPKVARTQFEEEVFEYADGGAVGRTVMIPTYVVKEINDSVKMGYDTLVEGMIGRKRKGVMLINEDFEVRGTYDIGLKDSIQNIIDKVKSGTFKVDAIDSKMAKGGRVKKYELGDMWSPNFNYNGMLKMGMNARVTWGLEKLQALSDSFEDVNYHTENIKLIEAIDFLKKGDEAKARQALGTFNLRCRSALAQGFAKGGQFDFKPYGKTKGKYKIEYTQDGEKQSEVWESKEMVEDRGKKLLKLGCTNIKITEVEKMARGGEPKPSLIPDYKKISGVEVEDIDMADYPDFSDAYISYAEYDGEPMTDEQLEELNQDGYFVYDAIQRRLFADGGKVRQNKKDKLWESIKNKFSEIFYLRETNPNEIFSNDVIAEKNEYLYFAAAWVTTTLSFEEAENKFMKMLTDDEKKMIKIERNVKDINEAFGLMSEKKILVKRIDKMADGGEMARGGKVKRRWIQDALSGNKGELRKTAKRKGLIKGDEKLSKSDLRKLEKMGGKTAKRARLAETLMEFKK